MSLVWGNRGESAWLRLCYPFAWCSHTNSPFGNDVFQTPLEPSNHQPPKDTPKKRNSFHSHKTILKKHNNNNYNNKKPSKKHHANLPNLFLHQKTPISFGVFLRFSSVENPSEALQPGTVRYFSGNEEVPRRVRLALAPFAGLERRFRDGFLWFSGKFM